jgi:hypothetical protein
VEENNESKNVKLVIEPNWDSLVEWTPEEMLEISLKKPDDFLTVSETLTRIGIDTYKNGKKTLIQSCHILHKRGRYFIVHFKEMFELDGKVTNLTISDIYRRNTIAKLLEEWELLHIVNPDQIKDKTFPSLKQIKIISYKQKDEYDLVSKYSIGTKKK